MPATKVTPHQAYNDRLAPIVSGILPGVLSLFNDIKLVSITKLHDLIFSLQLSGIAENYE
jgi:hypothetical protein